MSCVRSEMGKKKNPESNKKEKCIFYNYIVNFNELSHKNGKSPLHEDLKVKTTFRFK